MCGDLRTYLRSKILLRQGCQKLEAAKGGACINAARQKVEVLKHVLALLGGQAWPSPPQPLLDPKSEVRNQVNALIKQCLAKHRPKARVV
jgi:dihydrodipicolinate synthase/N-acetylneuraminate lyase